MKHRSAMLVAGLAAIVAVVLVTAYFTDLGRTGDNLPEGCTRPAGGFLIVASSQGYNDSIAHGAPEKAWPVLDVQQGATVRITVCNTDRQPHGFQIQHYLETPIVNLAPGRVYTTSFNANETGSFWIYCSTLCSIHVFMQNGQLDVS